MAGDEVVVARPADARPWGSVAGQRLARVLAVALLGGSVLVWLHPVDVPGRNFQPFGCGTAASPMAGQLAESVCHDALVSWRLLALCLLAAAALVLAVGEGLVGRLRGLGLGLAVGVGLGAPLLALGVWRALAPVTAYGADGSRSSCGTPVAPTSEPLAAGICASLPQGRLVDAVALVGAGLVAAVGSVHVLHTRTRPRSESHEA